MELETGEFGALVMEAAEGSGVVTEPGMVEGTGNSAAFFVGENEEFHEVGGGVNHGEG